MPADDPDPKDKAPDGEDPGQTRKWYEWPKRIYVGLASVTAALAAALTVGTQVGHWFSGPVSTCGISQSYQIERSPNLGISFHQNNQLALMSSVNPNDSGIPQTDVCLSSAPFEIWFPALGPKGLVQVCVSTIAEEFRINPFRHEANAAGCLSNNGDGPTPSYIGGFLPEASLQYGTSFMIFGKRAEPAANGDEKYYVSTLYSVPSAKSFTYNTIPLSKQTANLYMIHLLNK